MLGLRGRPVAVVVPVMVDFSTDVSVIEGSVRLVIGDVAGGLVILLVIIDSDGQIERLKLRSGTGFVFSIFGVNEFSLLPR